MRIDVILGYLITVASLLLGLVIALSVFNDQTTYGTNLIIAAIIIAIAVLFCNRTMAIRHMPSYGSDISKGSRRYLISNTLILSLELIIVLLLLSMAVYRMLGERMAVFG